MITKQSHEGRITMDSGLSSNSDQENRLTEGKILFGSIILIAILILARIAHLSMGGDVHSVIGAFAYGAIILWVIWFLVWAFLGGLSRLS